MNVCLLKVAARIKAHPHRKRRVKKVKPLASWKKRGRLQKRESRALELPSSRKNFWTPVRRSRLNAVEQREAPPAAAGTLQRKRRCQGRGEKGGGCRSGRRLPEAESPSSKQSIVTGMVTPSRRACGVGRARTRSLTRTLWLQRRRHAMLVVLYVCLGQLASAVLPGVTARVPKPPAGDGAVVVVR